MPIYLIWGIAWLVWVIGVSMVTAKHYQFSTTRGCVTMALSHIVLMAAYCGIAIIAGVLLFSAFSNSGAAF